MKFICNFDGACEPINPGGNMGIGALIKTEEGTVVYSHSSFVPRHHENSNNAAEYLALEKLIDWLSDEPCLPLSAVIFGDSMMVCQQINGAWRIKSGKYREHALRCKDKLTLLRKKAQIEIAWVRRELNQDADDLSKTVIARNERP